LIALICAPLFTHLCAQKKSADPREEAERKRKELQQKKLAAMTAQDEKTRGDFSFLTDVEITVKKEGEDAAAQADASASLMGMLGMGTKKKEEKVAVEVAGSGEMSASLMGMLGIAAPAPVVKQPLPVAVAGGKKGTENPFAFKFDVAKIMSAVNVVVDKQRKRK